MKYLGEKKNGLPVLCLYKNVELHIEVQKDLKICIYNLFKKAVQLLKGQCFYHFLHFEL
jgi:hypothetical protein